MLGSKLKSWMESQVAKVRQSKTRVWGREDSNSSGVPSSSSNDTSILLAGGSSMGSFTQNLSSPDTGYSTDGYSPKSHHPPLVFTAHVSSTATVSKTTLLTQSARIRNERLEKAPNQLISSILTSNNRINQESPRKPPRMSKIKQQTELEAQPQPEMATKVRTSVVSSSGDSGQGTLGSNRISGDSFGQYRFPNICEEPRETEILSDWAPTDEDVDEGVLTPTPTPPPASTSPASGIERYTETKEREVRQVIQPSKELPKAYETLQLLNQCNHVFPLPSCTGPRCLQAQMGSRSDRKHGKSTGPFGFIKRFFRRKSSVERDLPENSRGKPIRTGPTGYWLTPTPNSFRKRNVDTYSTMTIPKGVKSDIIRLPQTTPTTLPTTNSNATPTMTRQSPFLSRLNSNNASPASVRFKPQQIVTPIHQSPRPVVAFAVEPDTMPSPRLPQSIPAPSRIQPPSFNNYSPIHRLVVTTGVHHHRPAPESPLVRTSNSKVLPPPPPRQSITPTLGTATFNPRYQYIPSSNQNSPILNNVPRRLSNPVINPLPFENKHYYASPLVQNSCHLQRHPAISGPIHQIEAERIYERVEGTEVSDEGDGEGGDYEWDVSLGESEHSTSQGHDSSRSRHSQSSTQTFQAPVSFRQTSEQTGLAIPNFHQLRSRVPPMAWGTRLSDTEIKLLENEADLKYKKLIWEAEFLLRQFTMDKNRKFNVRQSPTVQRARLQKSFSEECPQSDPLRRKTYDCWALRRLQQEMALSCASPPVLHRSRHNLTQNPHNPTHHHHPVI